MNNKCRSDLTIRIGDIKIKGAAQKTGKIIGRLTGGRTNAEKVGKIIDKITEGITIVWER